MNFEQEVFKRKVIDFNKLLDYGFEKIGDTYKFSKLFMDNFRADILVDLQGNIRGKIYDLVLDDEYVNFRVENNVGEFVNKIRNEYKKILEGIVRCCTFSRYFIFEQSNRIAKLIGDLYGDEPEFLWAKTPGAGVFRKQSDQKWYGLIMNIDKSKISAKETGEIEIINLKLDEVEIIDLLKRKGFYPAYHMNKKNWITIVLDDSLSDEEIMKYVGISHGTQINEREWIVPSNPKYFDIIHCFNNNDTVLWKQSSHVHVGDMVYIYVGRPYSAILYKCEVKETDLPYDYSDKNLSMKLVMKLKLIRKFKEDEYLFTKLKKYGVTAIRGPRRMPKVLSEEINK